MIKFLTYLTVLAFGIVPLDAQTNADSPNTIRVIKNGGDVLIRSSFSQGKDLLIQIALGLNNQINFLSTFLVDSGVPMTAQIPPGAITIHGNGDDAAPWLINGTWIGGNHGAVGVCEVTSVKHGLTGKDLGGEWIDESGKRFYLIKIGSEDTVWFLGKNSATAPFWNFDTIPTGKSLTDSAGKRTLPYSECHVTQLRPSCRIGKQAYLANGITPLEDGKITICNFLEIAEDYEIINPDSLRADLIAHAGAERNFVASHLDAVLQIGIVYRFYPNGANIVDTKAKALQDFKLGKAGFVMTAPLTTIHSPYSRDYYIPKTKSFAVNGRTFDFQKIQNWDGKLEEPIYFRADGPAVESANNLPERFIQFLVRKGEGPPVREVGFALGYSLIQGITQPSLRSKNVDEAGCLHSNTKSYPTAIDGKLGVIPAGTEFHCVGYRDYFSPREFPNATCVYWHPEGKDILLYADYHQNREKEVIKLPAEFSGRKISVVESTPSVTLHTQDKVPPTGIVLSVGGGYGYIVLRLEAP